MSVINIIACFVICSWASWGVMSRSVRGGASCRALFGIAALSAAAVILGPHGEYTTGRTAEVTLNVALSLLCVRHILLKNRITWCRIKKTLTRRFK